MRKLREADRLLAEGAEVPEVAKALEVSEATYIAVPTTAATHWPPKTVAALQGKLEELAELVDKPAASGVPDSALGWLSRLLVVRSCGFVEQTLVEVARGYIRGRSGGPPSSFAETWLVRGPNPTPDALVLMTGRFDATWASDLEAFLDADDERLARELAFLVDRRNKIAHGLNEGIGPRKALDLKAVAVEVADWLIARFNPVR